MHKSSQFLHDPITDFLDDLCSQSPVPLASYEIKISYDIDLIRKSTSWSFSSKVSLQISSKNLHPYQELYNDIKNICAIPNYDHKFVESQEIGRVFHDPIEDYMEYFFILNDQSCFQTVSITLYNFDFVDKKSSCHFDCANKWSRSPLVSATT
jgi:hypothetical protein